jgi:hypothetical protein
LRAQGFTATVQPQGEPGRAEADTAGSQATDPHRAFGAGREVSGMLSYAKTDEETIDQRNLLQQQDCK